MYFNYMVPSSAPVVTETTHIPGWGLPASAPVSPSMQPAIQLGSCGSSIF
jgi:hypothetical protein